MIIRTSKLTEGNNIEEIDGKIVLTKSINLDPLLEHNYQLRKDSQDGWSNDRSYRHYGSVSMEILMQWKKEFPEILSGDRDAESSALRILFNRPENEVFMTVKKKIGSTL
jgi:hypothetical protein